jgi:hypothetical protein
MVEIIVSGDCPHCETQAKIMRENFKDGEYRIIMDGSMEYEGFDLKEQVDGYPFVVVTSDGKVRHAASGVVGARELRAMESRRPFNMSRRHSA